jgi:LysM repeat protein
LPKPVDNDSEPSQKTPDMAEQQATNVSDLAEPAYSPAPVIEESKPIAMAKDAELTVADANMDSQTSAPPAQTAEEPTAPFGYAADTASGDQTYPTDDSNIESTYVPTVKSKRPIETQPQETTKPKKAASREQQSEIVDAGMQQPALKAKDYSHIAAALAKELAPQASPKIRDETPANQSKPRPKDEHQLVKAGSPSRAELITSHHQDDDAGSTASKKSARYRVQEGDTLYSIARRHDMDVDDLKKMNRLANTDGINYGQTLVVSDKDTALSSSKDSSVSKKMAATPNGGKAAPLNSKSAQQQPAAHYTAHNGETLFSMNIAVSGDKN